MPVFNDYAQYYDLIYKNKNYREEAQYTHNLISKYRPGCKSLLDIGCGTGRHIIEFIKLGYNVTGVDISPRMIELAEKNIKSSHPGDVTPSLITHDVRTLAMDREFDVIVSLFHVMSYQTSDPDINNAFSSIRKHMGPCGIFIFDFWYAPAVLCSKPEKRKNRYTINNLEITRIALPEIHEEKNLVDVNYQLIINDDEGILIQEILETHSMRYYSTSDIETYLAMHGFRLLDMFAWMGQKQPDIHSWSACAVAGLK
ncbi:MAG TPA: class I SAM-dependent methyltransferase [Gammaproteobacteria bacterium]|nr:class I SAM-dependent methyltransferase [Gammaproteobacteria bacterium]